MNDQSHAQSEVEAANTRICSTCISYISQVVNSFCVLVQSKHANLER